MMEEDHADETDETTFDTVGAWNFGQRMLGTVINSNDTLRVGSGERKTTRRRTRRASALAFPLAHAKEIGWTPVHVGGAVACMRATRLRKIQAVVAPVMRGVTNTIVGPWRVFAAFMLRSEHDTLHEFRLPDHVMQMCVVCIGPLACSTQPRAIRILNGENEDESIPIEHGAFRVDTRNAATTLPWTLRVDETGLLCNGYHDVACVVVLTTT